MSAYRRLILYGIGYRTLTCNGNSFFVSLKKKHKKKRALNGMPLFFSVKPACSLRFPIAATQEKLVKFLKKNPRNQKKAKIKSYLGLIFNIGGSPKEETVSTEEILRCCPINNKTCFQKYFCSDLSLAHRSGLGHVI